MVRRRRVLPPRGATLKFSRPLEEIAAAFRPQTALNDCLVVALEGISFEFGVRRGFDLGVGREMAKELCGYRGDLGSRPTKMVPNLNIHLQNRKLVRLVEARESQGDSTTLAKLKGVCEEERTSFPIVGVGQRYWDVQKHAKVPPAERRMDHALVVLTASAEEVRYFDPFQRPGAPGSLLERVHAMPTLSFRRSPAKL